MNEPDDRELEQYLKGDSPLSRRYRDASAESAPPELDEAILARARAELRRKPGSLNRYLAPLALAASVMLGVNLAWNVYQVQPVPSEVASAVDKVSRDRGFVPSPPPVAESVAPKSNVPATPAAPAESVPAELRAEPKARAPAAAPAPEPARQEKFAADVERDDGMAESKREQEALRKAESQ